MAKAAHSRTALAPGRHWDSTQVCRWFDAAAGTKVDPKIVLRAHAMAQKVQARLASVAAQMLPVEAAGKDIRSHMKEAEAYVEARTGAMEPSMRAVYENAMQKAFGYVCGLEELPMTELTSLRGGLDPDEAGLEDDDEYGSVTWAEDEIEDYEDELAVPPSSCIHTLACVLTAVLLFGGGRATGRPRRNGCRRCWVSASR